jgi:aryl-alcohol dehydrogenase-like predicted oxidoreductase
MPSPSSEKPGAKGVPDATESGFTGRHCGTNVLDLMRAEKHGSNALWPVQHRSDEMSTSSTIPLRPFGKADIEVSAFGLGGHHLGAAKDEMTAVEIAHRALDGGVTLFDCCWEYNRGKSEDWQGKGIKGRRDQVFLMTKVCAHGRDAALAMQMLEQSLRRLQTDHLDLWQIHGVSFPNDPALFIRPGGAAEALTQANKEGRVRFTEFTGHKNPSIHLDMLKRGFQFDTVQMPINPFDPGYRSFEREVLPVAVQKGMAIFSMKSMGGSGEAIIHGVLTPTEALSYAMSVPGVSTTISGMDSMGVLNQNLSILREFQPLNEKQMVALREHGRRFSDGRYELFKSTVKYDGDIGREQHNDPTSVELSA